MHLMPGTITLKYLTDEEKLNLIFFTKTVQFTNVRSLHYFKLLISKQQLRCRQ